MRNGFKEQRVPEQRAYLCQKISDLLIGQGREVGSTSFQSALLWFQASYAFSSQFMGKGAAPGFLPGADDDAQKIFHGAALNQVPYKIGEFPDLCRVRTGFIKGIHNKNLPVSGCVVPFCKQPGNPVISVVRISGRKKFFLPKEMMQHRGLEKKDIALTLTQAFHPLGKGYGFAITSRCNERKKEFI